VLDRHRFHQFVKEHQIEARLKDACQARVERDPLHAVGGRDQRRVECQSQRRPQQHKARAPVFSLARPDDVAHQHNGCLDGTDDADPCIRRLHLAHIVYGEQGCGECRTGEVDELLDCERDEGAFSPNQVGVAPETLGERQAGGARHRFRIRQLDVARKAETDEPAHGEPDKDQLVVGGKAQPVQNLASDCHCDRRRQAQDGPTTAHQCVSPPRASDGVHHDGEGDADHGLWDGGHRPDGEHGRHGVLV
jgi:hypothetical protein